MQRKSGWRGWWRFQQGWRPRCSPISSLCSPALSCPCHRWISVWPNGQMDPQMCRMLPDTGQCLAPFPSEGGCRCISLPASHMFRKFRSLSTTVFPQNLLAAGTAKARRERQSWPKSAFKERFKLCNCWLRWEREELWKHSYGEPGPQCRLALGTGFLRPLAFI